jgi:hypothetical protein
MAGLGIDFIAWCLCRNRTFVWKGRIPSEIKNLDYLTDASYMCDADDANVMDFMEATAIIGVRDAVDEFLTCGIWPLSDN